MGSRERPLVSEIVDKIGYMIGLIFSGVGMLTFLIAGHEGLSLKVPIIFLAIGAPLFITFSTWRELHGPAAGD